MVFITSGINIGRIDRVKSALMYDLSLEEFSKAYNNWIQIFRIDGSNLTFEEYLMKMKEVGIKPFDVGNDNEQYHLSRYNDEGPYTISSCRFIRKIENLQEQAKELTPYMKTLNKYGPLKTKQIISENGRKGGLGNKGRKTSEEHKNKIRQSLLARNLGH